MTTILVTGGASGLGEAITQSLSALPDTQIYFTYNTSLQKAKELEAGHTNVKGIKCDFLDQEDLDRFVNGISELNIDVLINNAFAGTINKNHFHKTDVQVFYDGFVNNVIPTVKITRAAIASFRKKKKGKIITILSSALINRPPMGWSAYVSEKAYLESLSKSWAVENAAFNISANCISPSFMQTRLTSDTDERMVEEMIATHPYKKLLTTTEVAETIKFMVTATQHMNGVNVVLNAGRDVV